MVLELSGQTEVKGHVSGQNCADDQLSDLLHFTYNRVTMTHLVRSRVTKRLMAKKLTTFPAMILIKQGCISKQADINNGMAKLAHTATVHKGIGVTGKGGHGM